MIKKKTEEQQEAQQNEQSGNVGTAVEGVEGTDLQQSENAEEKPADPPENGVVKTPEQLAAEEAGENGREQLDKAEDPVPTNYVETAMEELHPAGETGQSMADVADRVEEETIGLTRAPDDTLRTEDDKVAWAPPGSHNAAVNGVQQDQSGHFESVHSTKSHHSGTRI